MLYLFNPISIVCARSDSHDLNNHLLTAALSVLTADMINHLLTAAFSVLTTDMINHLLTVALSVLTTDNLCNSFSEKHYPTTS